MSACFFIARFTITKFQPFDDPGLFKQSDSAIYGGDRNCLVNSIGTQINLVSIRMIISLLYYLDDGLTLRRHPDFALATFFQKILCHTPDCLINMRLPVRILAVQKRVILTSSLTPCQQQSSPACPKQVNAGL